MSGRDWAIQGSLTAISTVDMLETRHIVKAGKEENPLIGDHGQRIPFPIAGAIMLAAEFLISRSLPGNWRLGFESWALGAESYVVTSNYLDGWNPW